MDSRRPKQARLTDFFGGNSSQQRLSPELQSRSLSTETEEQSRNEGITTGSAETTSFNAEYIVDIGNYLETALSDELKHKILTEHWNPPADFVFPNVRVGFVIDFGICRVLS